MKRSPFLSDKDTGKMETLGLTAVVFLSSRRKLTQDSEADIREKESLEWEKSLATLTHLGLATRD